MRFAPIVPGKPPAKTANSARRDVHAGRQIWTDASDADGQLGLRVETAAVDRTRDYRARARIPAEAGGQQQVSRACRGTRHDRPLAKWVVSHKFMSSALSCTARHATANRSPHTVGEACWVGSWQEGAERRTQHALRRMTVAHPAHGSHGPQASHLV